MTSQSPQIGSSVQRTRGLIKTAIGLSRNPLKSGQAFKAYERTWEAGAYKDGRNPLKSGQAFKGPVLQSGPRLVGEAVAIPSNRVKRSKARKQKNLRQWSLVGRNPLKSGQAFKERKRGLPVYFPPSQSPQIGSSVQRIAL